MTKCEVCGEKLSVSVDAYKLHYQRFHSLQAYVIPAPAIRPIKTSKRSKYQIVHDMEKTWGHAIYPSVMPWQALGDR